MGRKTRVRRFEKWGELGEGGFARVFLAFDSLLGNVVALKCPKGGTLRDDREVETVKHLDHPHVVRLLDVVRRRNRPPLLVYEYHENSTLGDWLSANCDRLTKVPVAEIANLFASIAEALAYVHSKDVCHRDLSPSNILLAFPENRDADTDEGNHAQLPLRKLTPRVTDFGLAKWFGSEEGKPSVKGQTRSGELLGTPAYMAPEIASGNIRDATTAADIFSFGAMLFEMLSGKKPFEGRNDVEILRHVISDDPPSPRRFRPDIPAALATICLHCLHKNPRRRYASATDLATDLRTFLAGGRKFIAKPISAWEHASRWLRKHPRKATAVVATICLSLALAGGFVGYIGLRESHIVELTKANADKTAEYLRAEEERGKTAERLYGSRLLAAKLAINDGDYRRAVELLNQCAKERRCFVWRHLWWSCHDEYLTLTAHKGVVRSVTISSNGKYMATCSQDGTVRVWDAISGDAVRTFEGHTGQVNAVLFWPADEQKLVSASDDGTVRLWNTAEGTQLACWRGHEGPVTSLAFTDDQETRRRHGLLWSGGKDGTIRRWNVDTHLPHPDSPIRHSAPVVRLIAPDGHQVLYSSGQDGSLKSWDLKSGKEPEDNGLPDKIAGTGDVALTFTPGNTSADKIYPCLVSSHQAGWIDVRRGWGFRGEEKWFAHQGMAIRALAWLHDGNALISGGSDGSVLLWKGSGGVARQLRTGHDGEVTAIAVWTPPGSSKGQLLVSADSKGMVKVTHLMRDPGQEKHLAKPLDWEVWPTATPDGNCQVVKDGNTIRVVDRNKDDLLVLNPAGKLLWAAFSPDGNRLVAEFELPGGRLSCTAWIGAPRSQP